MDPPVNELVVIIAVVTVALFLVGLLRRFYHGGYHLQRSADEHD